MINELEVCVRAMKNKRIPTWAVGAERYIRRDNVFSAVVEITNHERVSTFRNGFEGSSLRFFGNEISVNQVPQRDL